MEHRREGIFRSDAIRELGPLADPQRFTDPVSPPPESASFWTREEWTRRLRDMHLIREAERVIGEEVAAGRVKCPCHLGIGQEGVAVGISTALRSTDSVFGGHRSHSHYLALGAPVSELIGEVFGKENGCSHGIGGSQHLTGREHGFFLSVPIVGATISMAVGAALHHQRHLQRELAKGRNGVGNIAVAYFGDGACEEGAFHESLNFAARYQLPVLFVCENNLYSSHLDIRLRQPNDCIGRFAVAHQIESYTVDGNDLYGVSEVAQSLVERLRSGQGPAFIEAVTYRWRGHVGPDENIDVGIRRKAEDLVAWKQRDPIRRAEQGLLEANQISPNELERLREGVRLEVAAALELARKAPYPATERLMDWVSSESGKAYGK